MPDMGEHDMKNKLEAFGAIARVASSDIPPETDVEYKVMVSLRRIPLVDERPFTVMALLSASVAIVLGIIGVVQYDVVSDPLIYFLYHAAL
jgi:hypothetical protein